mmetsp:Transcript_113160/g.359636  ORF Transcript_113160/g.359636 Transcript_113160/m.359636 type:complete len:732 (-) Transcript_113160:67-2262(-)|eukprot:CAMPEP_0203860334 /NCGR_PEP_ID=MMETSP0359-20131031/12366_1 /ASSEMBLY_ACC=CAM_ASM_000338 /TAXON_ID=268821 /ORGANISM="Scrippsiella Hangoei, Strain SHTV-5" /LENGTH=731 /DNA_ID=CAMNT_0050777387 /DNA_START=6 /DNA_END=2201 /DNA_ORIENTATION=-
MRPTHSAGAAFLRQRSAERSRSSDRKVLRDHSVGSLRGGFGASAAAGSVGYGSLYGFKAAVAVIVFYFGVKMLVQFEEILLPFIMALILVSVLEPVKQVTMEVLECTLVLLFQSVPVFNCCLRGPRKGRMRTEPDSPPPRAELGDLTKRLLLVVSILVTCCLAGRFFWIVARIVWLSGEALIHDFQFYQSGVQKRGAQVQKILKNVHLEKQAHMDMDDMCNMALEMLRYAAEFLTKQAIYTLTQLCLTVIFVLFLLYSPVQRDFSPVTKGVFESMELYLKLKTMISLTMGITNGIALAIIGLELPAAWGLMTFLANFIPNVGGPVMSILPCVIALLDIRKSFYQVSAAFLAQFFLHFNIANFVEPVIFGTTKDIHSVVVLLGLSFFGYIWGFTGMFLSVPLLFAMHAWLSVTALNPSASPEARDDARFLMGMLEGHWLGDDDEHQHYDSATAEAEMAALGDAVVLPRELAPAAGLAAAPDVGVQEVVEVVLPGGVVIEGLQSSRPSFGGIGDPPQCSLTEFPVTSWKITGALQVMFSIRHPETKEVQSRGLLLRWLLLLGIGLFIFEWDLHALIHPSSDVAAPATTAAAAVAPLGQAPAVTTTPAIAGALIASTTTLARGLATTSAEKLGDAARAVKALTSRAPALREQTSARSGRGGAASGSWSADAGDTPQVVVEPGSGAEKFNRSSASHSDAEGAVHDHRDEVALGRATTTALGRRLSDHKASLDELP